MKVLDDDYIINEKTIICLGAFDGIHLGHKALFDKAHQLKKELGYKIVVFTFTPNPIEFLTNKMFPTIFSEEERNIIFEELEVDYLILQKFDKKIAELSATDFIEKYLIQLCSAKCIIVGENYKFGKEQKGNATLLKKYNEFETFSINHYMNSDKKLSSTDIRNMFEFDNIEEINNLLYSKYFIHGKIVTGKQLGRTIGIPTINIFPSNNKIIPKNGVYKSHVKLKGLYYDGITNIGTNPTFDDKNVVCETHILNFNKEVYGEFASVYLDKFIRGEKKFNNIKDLKKQIDTDIVFSYGGKNET